MTPQEHIYKILIMIDEVTEPSQMSKEEALDFLESLCTDLESRCEALRDELR